MISSLQPSRPTVQPLAQPATPLHQQHTRSTQSQAQPRRPNCQIEAMPPSRVQPVIPAPQAALVYNPALTHPVFFTDSWRRPPFTMPFNNAFSPAAAGYIFGDARKRSNSMTKL